MLSVSSVRAQDNTAAPETTQESAATAKPAEQTHIVCESSVGGRKHCAADTSSGVALAKSTGSAPCLLGKTWGYDDTGIWTSDGCGGEFIAGQSTEESKKEKTPEYIPNLGFLLFDGEKGQIYLRLFTYGRYLNQLDLESTYVDRFGNTHDVLRQQNIQLTKFFAPFSGWFLTPTFRYYLYVWSSNASQGDAAQVVGAGQHQLHLQLVRHAWPRHHVAAVHAQHRRSVSVLARRRRPPHRRRVLSRFVHGRRLGASCHIA
jgi:hypothetical protein